MYLDNCVFILVSKQTNTILVYQNRDEQAILRKKNYYPFIFLCLDSDWLILHFSAYWRV